MAPTDRAGKATALNQPAHYLSRWKAERFRYLWAIVPPGQGLHVLVQFEAGRSESAFMPRAWLPIDMQAKLGL